MTDPAALADHVAVVTGASSGIGRATALRLSQAGAKVVVTARRSDRLRDLVGEIEAIGGKALAIEADVVSLEDVQRVTKNTLDAFGRIDILVNNAGIMPVAPIAEANVEDWTRMVDVNIKGVLHFLSTIVPHMIERGSGHLVSVGSVAGRRPFPGGSVYASWGLHLELGHAHGIRVTDIQPGLVATELLDGDPDVAAAWAEAWSDKRTLQADDIARAIEFAVTSPDHMSVSEILVRPTDQPT